MQPKGFYSNQSDDMPNMSTKNSTSIPNLGS